MEQGWEEKAEAVGENVHPFICSAQALEALGFSRPDKKGKGVAKDSRICVYHSPIPGTEKQYPQLKGEWLFSS